MDDGPFILDRDVSCAGCEYNLRGLPCTAVCPECACPVQDSLAELARLAPAAALELSDAWSEELARRVGCALDGVLFVFDALQIAFEAADVAAEDGSQPPRHVTARDICDAFRTYARSYFNDEAEAAELLGEWGVRRSEDVGRIIAVAVRSGRLDAAPDDDESNFAGRFTLETLFGNGRAP
jgi:uncharacterized repeat protein (TIGR04138 family)